MCRNGNRWLARISYGGKKHSLGGELRVVVNLSLLLFQGANDYVDGLFQVLIVRRRRHWPTIGELI